MSSRTMRKGLSKGMKRVWQKRNQNTSVNAKSPETIFLHRRPVLQFFLKILQKLYNVLGIIL